MSWVWAALVALATASMVIWLAARSRRLLSLWESSLGNRIRAFTGGITGALLNFRAAPVGLALAFAAAVCNHAALIAFYYAVAVALNVPVSVADMAVIVPILSLAQVIPVSINGLGVREATFTVLFARIGLSPENALAVSLGATALIIGFSSLGACLYVARGRASGSELLSTPAPHLASSAWRT
jgi:uncharacterized membrane protein YbhN (UPF0104 family)